MRIKPLFAPRHGPEREIMKQMLKAKQSIDFAMYTFGQRASARTVRVEVGPQTQGKSAVRSQLGDAAYDAAWRAGERLGTAEAVGEAIGAKR